MYDLIGISVLKSFRPFLTKELVDALSNFEFIILHTLGIAVILCVLFLYEAVVNQSHGKIVRNLLSLNQYQLSCVTMLSILTVISSLITLEAYRYMISAMGLTMMLKGLSVAMVVIIGALVFGEKYTEINLLGVFLIVLGIIFVNR